MRAYDLEVTGSLITTGSLKVVGDITAEQYQIRTTITQVTMSAVSGSSRFGDSVDDTHIFTGSLTTSGSSLKIDSAGGYSGSVTSTGSFGALAVAGKVTTHLLPTTDDTYDLGSATFQWRDIYTGDFHLNNTSREEGNVIDGTKGNWTIQEGREDLYLLNNETGKKFKFKLEEIE